MILYTNFMVRYIQVYVSSNINYLIYLEHVLIFMLNCVKKSMQITRSRYFITLK